MLEKDASRRRLVSTVVVLGVLAIAAAIAVPRIVGSARSQENDRKPFIPKGADEPDATPPVGLQRRSLLVRRNLAPALRELAARGGHGRVRRLRIASDRIDAQVITSTGRRRTIRHSFTGETEVLSDTASPGVATRATFAWSEIDALAPRRIVPRALGDRSVREFGYLVLLDAGGLKWTAFLTDGTRFSATADGRDVRPIGG